METFSASLLSLLLSAVGSHDVQKSAPTQPEIAKADTVRTSLVIDTEASYFPFSIKNEKGELVGFDIDLIHALCDDMKVQCKVKSNDWDALIPSLKAKKSDAIIAGMSITPERQQVIDFTQPYYNNKLVFVGKKSYRIDPNNVNSLKSTRVAVQRSTVEAQFLIENYPRSILMPYDVYLGVFDALKNGEVKLAFSSQSTAKNWLQQPVNKNYEIKGQPIDINDNYAIAMRKGDPMIAKFNQSLANLKANGTYDKISQKYFGQAPILVK